MIYLHKILPVSALPGGLTLLLAAAGLLLRRRGLLAVLWVASMPLAGDAALRAAEGGQVRRAGHRRAETSRNRWLATCRLRLRRAQAPPGLAAPAGSGCGHFSVSDRRFATPGPLMSQVSPSGLGFFV